MDKAYFKASKRFGWRDAPAMRKRWKDFQNHRKKIRERNSRLHNLFVNDQNRWNAELSKLTPAEQTRQRTLEKRKMELLKKLK